MTNTVYAVYVITPTRVEFLLHSTEHTAGGIGLYVNANKTEFMCFRQEGAIYTLSCKPLKLVDQFTYHGSNIHIYTYIYIHEVHTISFQTFFVWTLLFIVHTWNSSPLRSNLLRLQCTSKNQPRLYFEKSTKTVLQKINKDCTSKNQPGLYFEKSTTSGSPLVWACHSLFHLLNCLITTASELRE